MTNNLFTKRVKNEILRVGFLNRDSPEAREKYQKIYDIVIVDDESLSVPMKIVKNLISQKSE